MLTSVVLSQQDVPHEVDLSTAGLTKGTILSYVVIESPHSLSLASSSCSLYKHSGLFSALKRSRVCWLSVTVDTFLSNLV